MFYCTRCDNTGKIQEAYIELQEISPWPLPEVITPEEAEVEIKYRDRECPTCLGFGTAGRFLP